MQNDTQIPTILEQEPLAKRTAWRIGGPARYYAEPTTPEELRNLLLWAADREEAIFVLGGGSNLLIRDSGFPGLVIRYRAREWTIEQTDDDKALLKVQAAAPMAGTVRRVSAQGWGGLVWAEGLPGTLGGGVYGNAGCYGGDFASVLQRAWLLVPDDKGDYQVEEWSPSRLAYGYRTSSLKRQAVANPAPHGRINPLVLAAELQLERDEPAVLEATMARIASERKGKTPVGSSCGSVFKNPEGTSSGRLIEQAGLKGRTCGAAMVSERHANYIVNRGGASSDDVLQLIDIIRSEVLRQFGLELELEVVVIGQA